MPSAAENCGNRVVTVGEHFGDVVGLVEDTFLEVGETGVEEAVRSDGFAVEEGLVGAERGDGEACGLHSVAKGEVFAEKRGVGGDAVGTGDFGVAVGAAG